MIDNPYIIRFKYSIFIIIWIMAEVGQSQSLTIVQLRHMQLQPEMLTLSANTKLLLKICGNNSSALSDYREGPGRKFIFLLQQTDEETPPLAQKEQYTFTIPNTIGTYHLTCLNYTKIKATIQVIGPSQAEPFLMNEIQQTKIEKEVELVQLVEVEQQKEQEANKQVCVEGTFQKSNSKSEYAQYERMLNDETIQYDYMPNKYLKYFKEEFKLWRDFFDRQIQKPQKQKYGSQPKDNISSGSLTFTERESQKQESVISCLRSQQQVSQFQEEELTHPRIMKKTNSEYCFNIDREIEKTHMSSTSKRRPINTNTSSPHQKTEQSQADSFLDWACNWSAEQGYEEVTLKKKGDSHLVNQWLTFLHNKFQISQFMYG